MIADSAQQVSLEHITRQTTPWAIKTLTNKTIYNMEAVFPGNKTEAEQKSLTRMTGKYQNTCKLNTLRNNHGQRESFRRFQKIQRN